MAGHTNARTPHEAYYYYWGPELQAVRSGKWKLHFPHQYASLRNEPGGDGRPGPMELKRCALELYDLETDIGERTNVADEHPDIVALLTRLADGMRTQLGDRLNQVPGTAIRPAGRVAPVRN
jgi:arylsulfatase A